MATAAEKKLAKLTASMASRRARAREDRSRWTRRLTLVGTGYAVGSLVQSGRIESIPKVFGMPRTVVLGVAATLASDYIGGRGGDIAEGIGEGCLTIAAFQFGAGQEVAGDGYGGARNPAQLEAQLQEQLSDLMEQELEEDAA